MADIGIVCEKCGKELLKGFDTGFDDDDYGECPECGRLLCNGCAGWKVISGWSTCKDCAEKIMECARAVGIVSKEELDRIKESGKEVGDRTVVYEDHGVRDFGRITSWNEEFVFVCFDESGCGKACNYEKVRFENGTND